MTLTTEDRFKTGMQLLAASTNIVTSEYQGERSGMAATAVCSLTVDPPALLVCINRTARTYGTVMDSRKFAVNLVPDDMTEVVGAFSSKADKEQQFQMAGTWGRGELDLPVLKEAVASFECEVESWANTKTHAVFFGLVRQVYLNPDKSALIYGRKGFHKLTPLGK
ncbi:flavin reductase family protein [Ruegeria arenilitoris]|uniref:flavin reductase family protein n=1 Tax=Ruegeria arenilitoris TaxID=1173585 RepID=UPI0014807FCF|nr:flavin reductase family protein [Ruegeria arenilitoris]